MLKGLRAGGYLFPNGREMVAEGSVMVNYWCKRDGKCPHPFLED